MCVWFALCPISGCLGFRGCFGVPVPGLWVFWGAHVCLTPVPTLHVPTSPPAPTPPPFRAVPAVSFVLSRMSGCGGPAKSRVTVPKRVWEFVTRERAARLALLAQEARVRILVDGETPELYVLQLCAAPHAGPPRRRGALPRSRKALKALLKETEKELKKRGQRHPGSLGRGRSQQQQQQQQQAPAGAAGAPGDEEPERQCPICLGEMRGPRTCIARALQVRSAWPVCGRFYGQLVGNQPPDGRMLVTRDAALPLPGYEAFGTIIIQYVFPPGVQGVEHPNPGVRYPGTTQCGRTWPDCPRGTRCWGCSARTTNCNRRTRGWQLSGTGHTWGLRGDGHMHQVGQPGGYGGATGPGPPGYTLGAPGGCWEVLGGHLETLVATLETPGGHGGWEHLEKLGSTWGAAWGGWDALGGTWEHLGKHLGRHLGHTWGQTRHLE
uniref:E3 ubiquitin-protein ligase n=1 Tax=Malurus cyaneus samueli TaxID=2593467 RepID=A0A8C5TQ75_9PASS